LVPQGLAVRATPGVIRQVKQRKEKERQRLLEIKQQAEDRKTALETIGRFVIKKQAGEEEAIFGTVTTTDVAEAIQASTGQEIDRRGVSVPEISKIGFYKVQVKLHPEVEAEIEIQVVPL
ncbi:MAG: 50S ribosomal protein L9, partial [Okeania sp. SIO2D1]|nr:50S ribosomal protein L9 [Okeania sp. SIO2D1]